MYIFNLLDAISVKTILEFYNFCKFSDGSISGSSDKEKKYNEELSDIAHEDSLVKFADKAIKNCADFEYVIVPRATTYPKFIRYTEGMHYDYHNDFYNINGVKTDYSATCFLNPPEEYEGGELVLNICNREIEFKLNPGQCIVYPTGTLHKVNKVTSGERKVMIFWVESTITDSRIRNIFADFSNLLIKQRDKISENIADFEAIRYSIVREYGQF